MLIRTMLILLACGSYVAAAEPAFNWPRQEASASEFPLLNGHTNTVPDIIGTINGQADLVIFTEGNHFPALLPLVYQKFPQWLQQQAGYDPSSSPPLITVVTLPQVLIVEALKSGGIVFGSAVIHINMRDGLFPDLVMGGITPLGKLHASGMVKGQAQRFARHRGLAILVPKGNPKEIQSLEDLGREDLQWVMATPKEAGARKQYLTAFVKLLPPSKTLEAILRQERSEFRGRLGIQHRDVPYAVGNQLADAGVIFRHLAHYYAQQFPKQFEVVEVAGAENFPADIYVTLTAKGNDSALAKQFMAFLLKVAPQAYPQAGFATLKEPEFGESIQLSPAQ